MFIHLMLFPKFVMVSLCLFINGDDNEFYKEVCAKILLMFSFFFFMISNVITGKVLYIRCFIFLF